MADRALLYCRLSDPKDKNAPTLESQEALLREHCAAKGYEVVAVLRESHTAAVLRERPKIREALELLGAGAANVFLVRDVDRMVREQWSLAVFMDLVRERGGRVEFALEEFDESPVGKLILSVKAFAAEYEREKIRWRTVTGKRRRAESGKVSSAGVEKYGFIRDKVAGTRSINEDEAAVVRDVFRWVDEEGLSLRGVKARLNERAVPPPSAGKVAHRDGRQALWQRSQLVRMLRDPAYKGEEYSWRWKVGARGAANARPRDEWIAMPAGTVPAIVSSEQWERVQVRLSESAGERAAHTRNGTRQYLLRGRIRCLACGQRLYSEVEKGRRVYRCSSRQSAGGRCEAGKRVAAEPIEAWAWRHVAKALATPETLAQARPALSSRPQRAAKQGEQLRRLERLRAQHGRYVRLYGETDDELEREAARRELARVTAAIREEEAALVKQPRPVALPSLSARAPLLAAVQGRIDELDFEGRRLALEWLGVEIEASGREWRLAGYGFKASTKAGA